MCDGLLSLVFYCEQLPHRTGTPAQDLSLDDIVAITRATLVKISTTNIVLVLDSLLALLEDLSRPYKTVLNHPPHVLLSELYTLELIADCCASHWDPASSETAHSGPDSTPLSPTRRAALPAPTPLDESLVARLLDTIKLLFEPLPDGYILPAKTILDDSSARHIAAALQEESVRTPLSTPSNASNEPLESGRLLQVHAAAIESHVKTIIEYVTASTWSAAFDYVRNVIYTARTTVPAQGNPLPNAAAAEEERNALVVLRAVSYFWVDGQKLMSIVQEFCSSFLHFRKSFQNMVAIVTPLLITRWLDRFPAEFVQMHTMSKRRDSGPDTLFDMTHTVVDNGRRRALLYPLQTTLLFLLPDVFEVASNLREAKSGSMAKKVGFLDGLRKALRNRNEQAAYCLVLLLRAARHFDAESDSALLSYAMDVQDEVREAVFRRFSPGVDGVLFEQDIMTAAFVSLANLNFDNCVESLAPTCLASSAPHSFKISVIQACSHFARLGAGDQYQPLFTAASAFIQGQLQTMSTLLHEGYVEEQSAQRKAVESPTSVNIVCNIMSFLDASPMTLFQGPPASEAEREIFFQENLKSLISCMVAADESIRRLATGVARRLFAKDKVLERLRGHKTLKRIDTRADFWRLTSLILASICDRAGLPGTPDGLRSIHGYLESRLLLLKSIPELSELTDDLHEWTAASTKVETLLLVSLCSADIEVGRIVTGCIGSFLSECRLLEAATTSDTARASITILRNGEIFKEISSRAFRFTGLVAFQKRIRTLLRRMQYPSAGILDAWEIVFDRWLHLSKDVSMTTAEAVAERTVAEWRNYSGFLASLGGICTADQAANFEEPAISGLRWIDRLSSENHEEPLLNRYLRLSIQLLACANVRIRETMREVLSTEVPPSLYQPLFKALETELDVLFTGALEPSVKGQDNEIIFAEQAASLLKALVERLDTPTDLGAASSLHLGSLTLNFAKFLDGVSDTPSSLRVKIKICNLCEAVTRRKEHLNLRDDVRNRNQLLEYIFSWIARPRSPRPEGMAYEAKGGPAGSRRDQQDETQRVQKDLDKACLRSLAELTFRLPLQPGDGQTDAGTSELKSQMFHQYFNRFLSLLNLEPSLSELGGRAVEGPAVGGGGSREGEPSVADLAITILSNLLSANIDVGLKHSLSIGYHENVEIRTAFVRVLYNILVQGTEFNNLSDAAVTEKYDALLDVS